MAAEPRGWADLLDRVAAADAEHARAYPGERTGRQPVHTLYVPADRFTAATAEHHGAQALRLLDAHVPDDPSLLTALALDGPEDLRRRVGVKLAAEPVEDLRVDFEDGYGRRDDGTEDADALRAAEAMAAAAAEGRLPPFVGVRVKPFADGLAARSMRTLEMFLASLLEATGGTLPTGFVVTFPKIVMAAHVEAFAELLTRLETGLTLPAGSLRFEMQIETPEAVVDHRGAFGPRGLVDAGQGRCVAAHFGTFDYTAACGLLPREQRITHPACDFARHVMQTTLAGTGVRLSDGSTNVTPASDATVDVHAAWRAHAREVTHSLSHGYYQGWDLHPAQLPSRFAAVYAYLLADLGTVCARLDAWRRGQPGPGGVLDEPATASALLRQVRRAVDCGAVGEDEVRARTGIPAQELADVR